MNSCSQKLTFIALILAITIPISTGHRRIWRRSKDSDDTEHYLRDLCSKTDRSDECWNILKSELHRFDHSDDDGDIAAGVIDLAITKSKEIGDQLNRWHRDSDNDRLKEKYHLCTENYNDVGRDLDEARRSLDSDDRRVILKKIHDAGEGLKKCRREFGSGSFDPCHVADRNKELGLYLDIVRASAGPLAILIN